MVRWIKVLAFGILFIGIAGWEAVGSFRGNRTQATQAATMAPTAAATGAVMPATQASTAPQTMTPITLFMGYIANVQFAPLYVAIERGYFRDNGIDLKPEYSFD